MKDIVKKYGEITVRLAITHLFSVGYDNLTDLKIDSAIEEAGRASKGDLMTPELKTQILECCRELKKESLWNIMRFIKTDLDIDDATVTVGKIVQIRHNCTGDVICTLLAPSDVDQFDANDVSGRIDHDLEQHLRKYDDAEKFDYVEAAIKAFASAGKRVCVLPPHYIMYV